VRRFTENIFSFLCEALMPFYRRVRCICTLPCCVSALLPLRLLRLHLRPRAVLVHQSKSAPVLRMTVLDTAVRKTWVTASRCCAAFRSPPPPDTCSSCASGALYGSLKLSAASPFTGHTARPALQCHRRHNKARTQACSSAACARSVYAGRRCYCYASRHPN
jgi:hypothetical protein